ncbi:MAG TPA: methyltransferase domain-containing protein [bacterium]|nr:methyltransferase domain-containing protein [bacterium]
MTQERDYILGTHDEEIVRLGIQHRVWRPRALDAWRRAGFTVGQTILDIGCGPGYASIDLAGIVGDGGRVLSLDRSRRFLDTLETAATGYGLGNIRTVETDLEDGRLPETAADGAWCRWVFAFLKQPRRLLEAIAPSLRHGGVLVIHEYFDYSTWRTTPRCPEIEEFVAEVMTNWRSDGGEPDIGLQLPLWLPECGFEIVEMRPIIDIVPPGNFIWQWPKSFVRIGPQRLVSLGLMTAERAHQIGEAFERVEKTPHALMITPAVMELIARRR